MKFLIRHIFPLIAALAFMAGSAACSDELEPGGENLEISGKEVPVRLTADFMPLAESMLQSRSDGSVAFPGNAISNINDICLVIFDSQGKFFDTREIGSFNVQPHDRVPADASNGTLAGETSTLRATFDCELPVGSYYLYALANMGSTDKNGAATSTADYLAAAGLVKGVTTRQQFMNLRKPWDIANIGNDCGLTGFFTEGGPAGAPSTPKLNDAEGAVVGQLITVKKSGTTLHAWLRRMASKLTIGFDSSGLSEDVYVYLRDVRVYNIASSCNLFGPNSPASADELVSEGSEAQMMMFCNKEDAGKDDLSDIRENYTKWPCLTPYNNSLEKLAPYYPHLAKMTHGQNAPALFFYENMRGVDTYNSKLQDANLDGVIDYPNGNDPADSDYREGKKFALGTFIEVSAYYVSHNAAQPGSGTIKYRFMLGQNVLNDFNTERNFHYKLTLRLLGYANEVDWHIDYNTTQEDILVPNPCYISYGYNEKVDMPVLVYGELDYAEATIIRNDWEPSIPWTDEKPKGQDVYYEGSLLIEGIDPSTGQNKRNAAGFLSLLKPQYDAIGKHSGADINYLWSYWTGNGTTAGGTGVSPQNEKRAPLYKRVYDCAPGTHDVGSIDGEYRVTSRPPDYATPYKTTLIEIPLYTRERNLVKTTGLSGANQHEGYQRRAQVKLHVKYKRDGVPYETTKIIDVVQVERLTNPTGVWREWNNSKPFDVSLTTLNGINSVSFQSLYSRGSWSAEVEVGNDWLLLNGSRSTIYGDTDSPIEFQIKPVGLLSNDKQVRCGIVKVKYHNYSCIHRIFVRQGFAPLAVNEGDAAWHSYNLVTATTEVSSPLDEGSMFKFNNLGQPIASSNNAYDKYPWTHVIPDDIKDHSNDNLALATGGTAKWAQITCDYPGPETVYNQSSIPSTLGRMMEVDDIVALRDNPDNAFGWGVCYGDESYRTEFHVDKVYGFKSHDAHTDYGMRGCFVYNTKTGAQVFFPIGITGFGRRMRRISNWAGTESIAAKLRYATRSGYMPDANLPKMPTFKHIFRSSGACYWAGRGTGTRISNITGMDEPDKGAIALDLNYTSYDFNTMRGEGNLDDRGVGATGYGTEGTDAIYIRLLTGKIPTITRH